VRPEAVEPEGGTISGTVSVVQDTGPSTILAVDWAGQRLHIVTGRGRQWRPGDAVRPRFETAAAHLWPRETEGR
jgi:hypothetical protein